MVHHERENAEQRDRNHDHDRRTLQFVPSGPRAFFQLFPCLLDVSGQALELPLPPKETKERARDHHPDQDFRCLIHKFFPACQAVARTVCLLRTARLRDAFGAAAFTLRFAASEGWRRGRDSNPRSACAESGFQDRRDRPLCHLSGFGRLACRAVARSFFARSLAARLHARSAWQPWLSALLRAKAGRA